MVEPSQKKSTAGYCSSCGREPDRRDENRRERRKPGPAATTFQVVVACASCRTVFAALSRN